MLLQRENILFQLPLFLALSGGKHLENNICGMSHCSLPWTGAAGTPTSSLLLYKVRADEPVHSDSLRCPERTYTHLVGVLWEMLQETFDVFIFHTLGGTRGSPVSTLASGAVCVISLQVEKV